MNLRQKVILIAGLLLFSQAVYPEIVIEKLEDPPYLNPDGTTYTVENQDNSNALDEEIITRKKSNMASNMNTVLNNLSNAQLSKIERKVFGRNFVGDAGLNRLARLEQRVFGAVQNGDATIRLKRLNSATKSFSNNYANRYNQNSLKRFAKNYNNFDSNPYNMYAPYRPYKRTGLKEFFKVVTGGSLTGFSPSVNNFANMQSGYNSPYSGYNNQNGNNGYSWSNSYQNPFSGSTYNTYAGPNLQNPYNGGYYSNSRPNSNFMDLFSNGSSGSEMYYDDGQYKRNVNSTGGGCGVKIIY